ncbi:MAG TPA: gliding motility-associated C-terminal domain-containing protein, partial [Nitrosopumilaceae archaeon]|nr:gliding motility-associated C-terminal domain-containing protein [Nitrosopumilaceae archaeon]
SFNDPSSGTNNTSNLNNPSHVFADTGKFCVKLVVSSGTSVCKDTSTTCIQVMAESSLIIPNVFTPNGDGNNDVFSIKSAGLKDLNCSVYDRWGLLIYSWDGITGFWDGRTKSGTKVPDGVYYYIVITTDFTNTTKKTAGFVQLIQ